MSRSRIVTITEDANFSVALRDDDDGIWVDTVLLTADYWRGVKRRRLAGEVAELVPYERRSVASRALSG